MFTYFWHEQWEICDWGKRSVYSRSRSTDLDYDSTFFQTFNSWSCVVWSSGIKVLSLNTAYICWYSQERTPVRAPFSLTGGVERPRHPTLENLPRPSLPNTATPLDTITPGPLTPPARVLCMVWLFHLQECLAMMSLVRGVQDLGQGMLGVYQFFISMSCDVPKGFSDLNIYLLSTRDIRSLVFWCLPIFNFTESSCTRRSIWIL